MSRFNYTPLQQSATRLITKFGAAYAFERLADRGYDAESGKPITRRTVYTRNAVVVDFDRIEASQTTVQEGDIKLLAETDDYKIGDTVSVNDLPYRIVDISTIQGSLQVMAVYLHLRK